MPTLNDVRQQLKNSFDCLDEKGTGMPKSHHADFRASSGSSMCPRDVALTRWAKQTTGRPNETWRLASLFYVEMGTAVHRVAQAYLGYKRLLWGSWECKFCRKLWLNQIGPGELCCGELPEYIEYSMVHPNKFIGEYGHCDGIHPLGLRHYVIVEFKTISMSGKEERIKHGPYEDHEEQASVYGEMAKKGMVEIIKRGPPEPGNYRGSIVWRKPAALPPGTCVGILIIYIPRDNPEPKNWAYLLRPVKKGVLAQVEAVVPAAVALIKKGKAPEGRCRVRADARDEYGTWCPWTETCFSPKVESIIAQMATEAIQKNG